MTETAHPATVLTASPCGDVVLPPSDTAAHVAHCGACAAAQESPDFPQSFGVRTLLLTLTIADGPDVDEDPDTLTARIEHELAEHIGVQYLGAAEVRIEQVHPGDVVTVNDEPTRASELRDAIDDFASTLRQIDSTDPFTALTCTEVETLARLLRVAGEESAADHAIHMHAYGDDEGDRHHDDWEEED